MDNIGGLIVIALLCTGLGILIGRVIFRSRTKPAQPPTPDAVEVARLWRDRRQKAWLLESGGKVYPRPAEVDETLRKRLAEAFEDVSRWLGGPASEAAPDSRPPTVSVPEMGVYREPGDGSALDDGVDLNARLAALPPAQPPAPPVHPAAAPASGQPVMRGSRVSLHPREPGPPDPPKRLSMNPVDIVTRAVRADVPASASTPMSIAAQVDEILQEMLEGTPLHDRGIRLMELPGKGLVVMVGLEHFDGVGSVPDPEVRAAIQAAAAEWERRSAE